MNKTGKITIRTTELLKTEIEQYAKLKGISTGKLIRNWVEVLLQNQLIKPTQTN